MNLYPNFILYLALIYARGGAAAISVLTEPHWFKGSLNDMLAVRKSFDHSSSSSLINGNTTSTIHRPAVLCKDFIITPYQILQARLHGAGKQKKNQLTKEWRPLVEDDHYIIFLKSSSPSFLRYCSADCCLVSTIGLAATFFLACLF